MSSKLPLSALLSETFVAFVIEFDNEFEHQVPHRTTAHGSTPGTYRAPWLVSMAMWMRYMRHIPHAGISVAELQRRIGISNKGLQLWLTRLGKWWGYLTAEPALPGNASKRIPPETIIRPTLGGQKAIDSWRNLTPVIEQRWRERFGEKAIRRLETSLAALAAQLDPTLPDFFSVLEYDSSRARKPARTHHPVESLALPELLAKTLIAFSREFDHDSTAPLALSANLLRLTSDAGEVRLRDLPRLSSLSKESVASLITILERKHLGAVTPETPGSRIKHVILNQAGILAGNAYLPLAEQIEKAWTTRFGKNTLSSLRSSLEPLVLDDAQDGSSPLLRGIVYYPDGWRASLPPLAGLPHFPMVSHRGGYPDGS